MASCRLALGVAFMLVACSSNDGPPPPPFDGPISASPAELWASNTLTLRAADFAVGGDDIAVTIGGLAAPATRADDTTFSATVPSELGGRATLVVRWRDVERTLAPLVVYGFDRVLTGSVLLPWDLRVLPGTEPVVMAGDLSNNLVLWNLVTGVEQLVPGVHGLDRSRGPGPTPDPNIYLLSPPNAPFVERWRLFPTAERLDTLPVIPGRQVMQLSENVVFRSTSHQFAILTRPDPSSPFTVALFEGGEETESVFLSPRGDRAAIAIDGPVPLDVPVFDAATGSVAWRASSFSGVTGAEFSADGATLLFVGPDSAHGLADTRFPVEGFRVELRDATTGEVRAARAIDRNLAGATFDPIADLVYVITTRPRVIGTRDIGPGVLVLRRSTLETVAELEVPANATACLNFCYKAVAAVSTEPALYVVTEVEGSVTGRYRFTLPAVR